MEKMITKLTLTFTTILLFGNTTFAQYKSMSSLAEAAVQSLNDKDLEKWKTLIPDPKTLVEIGKLSGEVDEKEALFLQNAEDEATTLKFQSRWNRKFVGYYEPIESTSSDNKIIDFDWANMQYQSLLETPAEIYKENPLLIMHEGWILLEDRRNKNKWVLPFEKTLAYKNQFWAIDLLEPTQLIAQSFEAYVTQETNPEKFREFNEETVPSQLETIEVPSENIPYAEAASNTFSRIENSLYTGLVGNKKVKLNWTIDSDGYTNDYSSSEIYDDNQNNKIHFDQIVKRDADNYILITSSEQGTYHISLTKTGITGSWVSENGSEHQKIMLTRVNEVEVYQAVEKNEKNKK